MPSIVRIADPRGSAPSPLRLMAAALGGAALGVLLLKLSLVAPRPETLGAEGAVVDSAPEGEASGDGTASDDGAQGEASGAGDDEAAADGLAAAPAEEAATDAVAPELEDSELAAAVEPPAPVEAPAEPLPAPDDAAAEETAPAGGGTLTRGRVAYFQCPGGECPRDHGFERAVWRALERVPACLGGGGEADVRVTVEGGAVTEVRFRERGATGIALSVLDRCVTPPLRRVAGSSLGDGTVVSFRFDVR